MYNTHTHTHTLKLSLMLMNKLLCLNLTR